MNALRFALWLLLLPFAARGHVGSPNVFYEGQAGPHSVRVIIRPPATLPGPAQVDVRVGGDGATDVSLQAALWEAGREAAPAPQPASAVAGDDHLFHAALWLFRDGAYSIRVTVGSPSGSGTAVVPLTSAATQRPATATGARRGAGGPRRAACVRCDPPRRYRGAREHARSRSRARPSRASPRLP